MISCWQCETLLGRIACTECKDRPTVTNIQRSVCLSVCMYLSVAHNHTHPFNDPLSRTARVGRYQKGKTSLDFTKARDSEWQWHQLDQSAPRSRQITTPAPHHSVFYRPDALAAAQPTASKHWRQFAHNHELHKNGWTNQDAVWGVAHVCTKNCVLGGGLDPQGKRQAPAMPPFVKILWSLVYNICYINSLSVVGPYNFLNLSLKLTSSRFATNQHTWQNLLNAASHTICSTSLMLTCTHLMTAEFLAFKYCNVSLLLLNFFLLLTSVWSHTSYWVQYSWFMSSYRSAKSQ